MNRRDAMFALLAIGTAGAPLPSRAQRENRQWSVGSVSAGTYDSSFPYLDAFLAGMKEYGYVGDRNLVVDRRFAEGNPTRLPVLVEAVIALKPDVLLGTSAGVALAMKRRTATLPIVMCTVSDAVGTGLAKSLARPGGNVTGLSMQLHELGAKHIEIAIEFLPQMRRAAVLTDASQPKVLSEGYERIARTTAAAKGLELAVHRVDNLGEIRKAIGVMKTMRADALLLNPAPRFNTLRREICQAAMEVRLPSIGWEEIIARDGGLVSYGPSFTEAYRRVAYFVDRIFKGAMPGDLPIEQPTKFSLIVNGKVATALGLKIPQVILLRAERVIE
jgi:putative ABC transport system substrate-binding protein